MRDAFSLETLAQRLAALASQTRDPETAVRLIELADEVLSAAGLPALPRGAEATAADGSGE